MEDAAATSAAAARPAHGVAATQRQDDDNNIMSIFRASSVNDVLDHIAGFMSTSTLLLFASAFPVLSYSLVQASDKAASAHGWEIIIGSATITESDASSPPLPTSSAKLASRLNDRNVHRMLTLVKNYSSKPLKLLAMRGCVNVNGTGLAPLRHFNFAEVEYLDLGSLVTVHHGGVFSNILSILIDAISRSRKLKYLRLPDGWLAVAGEQFQCVGNCCSLNRKWTWAREWCHACGSGPYCDIGESLVECNASGVKFCKDRCVRGDTFGDPFTEHNAGGCPLTDRCNEWYCLCGCNNARKKTCFDCERVFHCCIERCVNCWHFTCASCNEGSSHYNAECCGECDLCDYQYHTTEMEFCECCAKNLCRRCADDHRVECTNEFVRRLRDATRGA